MNERTSKRLHSNPGMRLNGLIRKETLQILRDPSSIAIAFLLPLVLLLIFGYGVSLDAEHVPIALVIEQPNADTSSFTGAFARSRYFKPIVFANMHHAKAAMDSRDVSGVIHLRSDFSRRLHDPRGSAIQVIVNGVDANTARLVSGYIQGVWANWLEQRANQSGAPLNVSVKLEQRVWFNSELRSRNYLVPGLIAVIMTLIGALLTSMVVAREWERGTMEAMMVTPVHINEILLGKLIPYFVLGMGGMILSVMMAVWLFEVPLRGSFVALFSSSALFMLVSLGMGLLISIVAKNQFAAGQIALVATFLPAFLLSGFIFDIGSMPFVVQVITHIIPARFYVSILQTSFLAGDVWSVLIPNTLVLFLMTLIFLGVARLKMRKRLE